MPPYISLIANVGQHNDSRMNIALIMSAVKHGAIVANYCEVMKLNKGPNGKINGVRVKDNLTGEEWNIRTKVNLLPRSLHIFSLNYSVSYILGSHQRNWPIL